MTKQRNMSVDLYAANVLIFGAKSKRYQTESDRSVINTWNYSYKPFHSKKSQGGCPYSEKSVQQKFLKQEKNIANATTEKNLRVNCSTARIPKGKSYRSSTNFYGQVLFEYKHDFFISCETKLPNTHL